MSSWTERKVARQLSEREPVEPPEGLLAKLKSEIPPDVGSRFPAAVPKSDPALQKELAEVVPMPRRQRWLIAASLAAMVGAGLFAMRTTMDEATSPGEFAAEEAVQEAPQREVSRGADTAAPPAPRMEESVEEKAASPLAAPAEPVDDQTARLRSEVQAKEMDQNMEASPAQPVMVEPSPVPEPAKRQRRIDVTSESPLLDERRTSTGATRMQAAPPPPPPAAPAPVEGGVEGGVVGGVVGGVAGGSPGGVPSGVVGQSSTDDVVITDMAALGNSPEYYDFEGVTEMQVEKAAPPQAMQFQEVKPHPFIETSKDRLSTFGLDVDTASYTVARNYLRQGHLPPREAIRVEEFVNYFSYGDPAPTRGDFALRAEGARSIFSENDPHAYLLRFNLKAREVRAENRKPAVLTFVVDVSGSMDQQNRLGLVKQSLGLLLDQLRKDDKVGLVVYGDTAQVILEPTTDRAAIRQAIEQLAPTGSTNAEAGIALGYDVAVRNFRPGSINRVLLCSDGVANVGATGPEQILQRIQSETRRGVELTTLGFGMGNYNDALMEQLADKGNGRYAYLDDLDEAKKVLVEELTGTLLTIAEDAKVQVDFNPAVVASWRLIGYENRAIPDEKFRDNSVDAGEIGSGHSVTALYEVKLKPRAAGRVATLHLRFRVPGTGELRETTRDLQTSSLVADWKNASPGFRLASVVAEMAETLRGSSHQGDLRKILRRAQRLVGEMADKPRAVDVEDFVRMVSEAERIRGKVGKPERKE
jgi:Ca-activated chloride channel family protein